MLKWKALQVILLNLKGQNHLYNMVPLSEKLKKDMFKYGQFQEEYTWKS